MRGNRDIGMMTSEVDAGQGRKCSSLGENRVKYTRRHRGPIVSGTSLTPTPTATPLHLNLMMLSCEDKPPYGPSENTANMFLDLISRTRCIAWGHNDLDCEVCPSSSRENRIGDASVTITVYECKQMDYPDSEDEWNSFHGILIPGSFNSAYDDLEWINCLKKVIIDKIQAQSRKTLGVCFGHQIFAHALKGESATKCPAGPQAGVHDFELSTLGKNLLSRGSHSLPARLSLLYTHGDMVSCLPDCGISLGGNESVPIQSVAYLKPGEGDEPIPFAFTFQAHPEYCCSNGDRLNSFAEVVKAMEKRSQISSDERTSIMSEVEMKKELVVKDSLRSMLAVCSAFCW